METTAGRSLLLGLDVGTQSVRAVLVDRDGRTVSFGIAPIQTYYPRPTWAEQEPTEWWSSARAAVQAALSAGRVDPERGRGDRAGLYRVHGGGLRRAR